MSKQTSPYGAVTTQEEPASFVDSGDNGDNGLPSTSGQTGVRKARVVKWSRNGLILAYAAKLYLWGWG